MKTTNKYKSINIILGVVLIAGMILVTGGCEKENEAAPVLKRVRDIDPALADEDLIGAGLGSWIVIQGENLESTKEVYFNDYPAYFNPTYVSETNIVVQIPEEAPNVGTDPDAPNTLRVVNKYGEATMSFITFAPPAQIEYISNEFAADGDTILLVGRYFFLVDSIIFGGDIPATQFEAAANGLSCSVVVPEGTEPGPVTVVTAGGTGGSMYGATMRETRGMICDFDAVNTWEGWGGQVVNPATNPVLPELTGQAFLGTGTNVNVGTYWVQEMAMPITSGLYPRYDTVPSPDNIFVKFELFAQGPWNSGEYRVTLVRRNDAGDWVETYIYPLKPWYIDEDTQVDFEPGSWVTVAIPISEFSNDAGEFISGFSEISDFNFFGCYFQNTGQLPGEAPLPLIQIGIDNIRMVGWNP